MTFETAANPAAAIDRLEHLYGEARAALRRDLQRFFDTGQAPTPGERAAYRYPLLRVTYEPSQLPAATRRGYAKFAAPGVYSTTITQPAEFRGYLLDQLQPLVEEYGATIETGVSDQEIPYPYALDGGDELGRGKVTAAELARHFPTPLLSLVGDEIADGTFDIVEGQPRPLSLFDAVRVDYSLRRLVHYTGTDWRAVQPWVLLTNYHRYVDQFVRLGLAEIEAGTAQALVTPGGVRIERDGVDVSAAERVMSAPWHRFQMPAYHLLRRRRQRRRDADQHWRRPLQRQEHHRSSGCAAPALLADGRPLRRPAADADHRRLRAGPRLYAAATASSTTCCRPTCPCRRWPRCRSPCRRRQPR